MLKFLNKKKNDNKGFSLVELIIVVAIMAILVGLLAPQYIKYVEKSRKSADASNLSEMVNAVQVYAADEEQNLAAGTYTIKIDKDGTTVSAAIEKAISASAPDYKTVKLKSNKWLKDATTGSSNKENATEIEADIEIDNDGGTKVTYKPAAVQEFVKGNGTGKTN